MFTEVEKNTHGMDSTPDLDNVKQKAINSQTSNKVKEIMAELQDGLMTVQILQTK